MNADFFNALDLLEREKGIPKEYMIEKIELALANACRKEVGPTAQVRVQLEPTKNDFRVFWQRTVVPDGEVTDPKCEISLPDAKAMSRRHKLGGVVEVELKTKNFRRLSAIAGKQMIIQAVRDAERERQTREYEEKREEIITAIVDKVDTTNGNLILDTGTGYATLMKADQIPGETHEVGDRLKVFVTEVKTGETRGPIVSLSRVHPNFVKRLFELEFNIKWTTIIREILITQMKDIMFYLNQNMNRVELGPGNPSDSTQQETLLGGVSQEERSRSPS